MGVQAELGGEDRVDRYGGERRSVLMTANEPICRGVWDAVLRATVARLVA